VVAFASEGDWSVGMRDLHCVHLVVSEFNLILSLGYGTDFGKWIDGNCQSFLMYGHCKVMNK
jgi:hypothetical protein